MVRDGFDTFITGMAQGVDIWAAQEVLDLKESGMNLHLVCALPFPGFENNRSAEQKLLFKRIIDLSDRVEYICPKYRAWCFKSRNRWLVEHSSSVIAVFNGASGGTKQTLEMAESSGRKIYLIDGSEDL